jgi:type IV pilus assembly protein PilE
MHVRQNDSGFTIIELLVVALVVGILSTLVITTYSGVQAKNRNSNRQASIDMLQSKLETYFAQNNTYPTLANVNDPSWRKANLKDLDDKDIRDPRWSKDIAACTKDGTAVLSASPTATCYSYQVTTSDGSVCDNKGALCAQYTLTTMLEGGGKYVKSSLN